MCTNLEFLRALMALHKQINVYVFVYYMYCNPQLLASVAIANLFCHKLLVNLMDNMFYIFYNVLDFCQET